MSQENVEILKASFDAYNRRDWDAWLQHAARGFEMDMSRAVGPVSGILTLDQLRQGQLDFAEYWESVRIEPQEFIEAGDLVVVPWAMNGTGRDGIELVARATFVWTIRDGAIERVSLYQSRQDALVDLGLSEQDAQADP